MKRVGWKAAALLGLAALAGCESNGAERGPARSSGPAPFVSREGPPVITGVAIDAATGKPLPDVLLSLPDGTTARSGKDGRFELRGMEVGLSGVLRAEHASGLEGENQLLPLAGGRLDVVVRLRRPRGRR